jgi:hypothetical protein
MPTSQFILSFRETVGAQDAQFGPHLNLYCPYLTLRSVSSLNNPQNSEMKICKNYEVVMLKIIIIIIGYTLNNFTISFHNIIIND